MMTSSTGRRGTIVQAGSVGATLPNSVDVVVVGSGGSGLMAALSAVTAGASVLVLEAEGKVGGTTAISGGAVWIPNHGYSSTILKASDSPEAARTYLLGQGRDGLLDHDVVDAFVETAPKVARFVEDTTYLSWIPVAWPDYTSDIPGASSFRSLFPGPFPPEVLGEDAATVRPPKKSGMARNPLPLWLMNGMNGVWIAGYAMVGAFLHGCLTRGVEVRTHARVTQLVRTDAGAVTGVVFESDHGEHEVGAAKGVVIATGGFEGSDDLTSKYLGAPFPIQVSPDGHVGDALQLAEAVGADMVALDQAWWQPGIQVPGEELEGRPISRLVQGERALPHTIMVNHDGKRFANEAVSYNDLGAVMRTPDESGAMPNASAWMIFDEYYHRHYSLLSVPPGGTYPPNVLSAPTLEALAEKCGIDPDGLTRTVREFNPEAAQGRDPWFHRGTTRFERFFGDHNPFLGRLSPNSWAPSAAERARLGIARAAGPVAGKVMGRIARAHDPERMRRRIVPVLTRLMRPCLDNPASGTLGPIDTPPYYAVKIETSAIGTIGGPRTDARGRVLDTEGQVIPGLYAAGNAGGATTRGFYGGAGGTITLGITFGYLAGRDAAARP